MAVEIVRGAETGAEIAVAAGVLVVAVVAVDVGAADVMVEAVAVDATAVAVAGGGTRTSRPRIPRIKQEFKAQGTAEIAVLFLFVT